MIARDIKHDVWLLGKTCGVIAYLLCFTGGLRAQTIPEQIHFDHLTIRQGLTHNRVLCVQPDHHGYIWIGTQNGLNRYDGYSLNVYVSQSTQPDSFGFVGQHVSCLYEDRAHNLWVGTRNNGINLKAATSDCFQHVSAQPAFDAIRGAEISSFYEDHQGNIWIATSGKGLLVYQPHVGTSHHFSVSNSRLTSNFVFDVVQDHNQHIWVAAAGEGIHILGPDSQFTLIQRMHPDQPYFGGYRKSLWLDGPYIWVGTEGNGLYRISVADRSYQQIAARGTSLPLSSNNVRDLVKAQDGTLFIATDGGGLYLLDPQSMALKHAIQQEGRVNSLNSNALICLAQDANGLVWIGTYNGGINVYNPHKTPFEQLLPPATVGGNRPSNSVISLYQTQDDKIWIGTDGGGLRTLTPDQTQFSQEQWTTTQGQAEGPSGNVIKSIYQDRRGEMWIGTFRNGLNRFTPETQTWKAYPQIKVGTSVAYDYNVWDIEESADGQIWIGTAGNGLFALDPIRDSFRRPSLNQEASCQLSSQNIMVLYTAADETLWIGHVDQGIDLLPQGSNCVVHLRHDPADSLSLSSNEIRAIYQDHQGRMWIGTEGGGLNLWLGKDRFRRIQTQHGLISDYVMAITGDTSGNIWISTYEGISRLDPNSGKIYNEDFRRYDQTNQFNQMAALTAKNNRIFFGGIMGIHALDPATLIFKQPEPTLLFSKFQVFDQQILFSKQDKQIRRLRAPIEQAQEIHLQYADNSFSIEFTAVDYTRNKPLRLQYMMEGFDQAWQTTYQGQYTATYTNLDPGTYTFSVRAGQQTKRLVVSISPPFWQTWWFRSLGICLIISLLWLTNRILRNRQAAAHNRQLLEAQSSILRLRNEKLAADVDAKNAKLMLSAAQMAHKNEVLTEIRQEVEHFRSDAPQPVRFLLRRIDKELKNEDYWQNFALYFNEVDKGYLNALQLKHPELTPNDLRMCALIRTNLTIKETASLLNISVRGVEQSRYRLKKRLGLGQEEDLARYLTQFRSE